MLGFHIYTPMSTSGLLLEKRYMSHIILNQLFAYTTAVALSVFIDKCKSNLFPHENFTLFRM